MTPADATPTPSLSDHLGREAWNYLGTLAPHVRARAGGSYLELLLRDRDLLLARAKELAEGLERIAARSRRIIDGEISTGVVGHANYCISVVAALLTPKESPNG